MSKKKKWSLSAYSEDKLNGKGSNCQFLCEEDKSRASEKDRLKKKKKSLKGVSDLHTLDGEESGKVSGEGGKHKDHKEPVCCDQGTAT